MICFLNILIYLGLTKYYFSLSEDLRSTKNYNKNGDGVVDVIILVLSFILFLYLKADKSRNEEQQMKQMIFNITNTQNQIIVKVNYNSEQINLIKNQTGSKTN